MRRVSPVSLIALLTAGLLAGCSDSITEPGMRPQFDVGGNGNGAVIEVGEYGVSSGRFVWDAGSHLVLFYRMNDGFPCRGLSQTQFVLASYRDIVRMDESWRTIEEAAGLWFYVYDWDGVTNPANCAFLVSHQPLASGRGSRRYVDNDFYPFDPYGPGPGANAFLFGWHGDLTTATGAPVQFSGLERGTVAADGITFRNYEVQLMLSPDPRR